MRKGISIAIIAAYDINTRLIGKKNKLLWHIPEDLKYFKKRTLNHAVIMGRKTYDSLGKPLPNRFNITLTKKKDLWHDSKNENLHLCYSLNDALKTAIRYSEKNNLKTIFIIGGGEVYEQFIDMADKLFLTEVDIKNAKGDTYFPATKLDGWTEVLKTKYTEYVEEHNKFELWKRLTNKGKRKKIRYRFLEYVKKEKIKKKRKRPAVKRAP